MRSLAAIMLLCVVAAGCGFDAKPDSESSAAPAEVKPIVLPTEVPGGTIGLIKDSLTLQVGDPATKGFEIFAKPEKASSIGELPEGVGLPKGLRADGWLTEKQGFGMFLRDNLVVGALYSEESVPESRIDEVVATYKRLMGEPTALPKDPKPADVARYWIWEDTKCRCVMCAAKNPKGQTMLTVGMGYLELMDALGMSGKVAEQDMQRAQKILTNTAKG